MESYNIWEQCLEKHSNNVFQAINTEAYRIIEAQHIFSTRKIVDSMDEYDILESLLEKSKPGIPINSEFQGLHYLFFTPFRYPPLDYGSRFGSVNERSLWYGTLDIETALAEVAFYRFLFFSGMSEKNIGNIEVFLTSFIAEISTNKGLKLTESPFIDYREFICSPIHYLYSRPLGTKMREQGVEAFLYHSARHKGDNYINIGLFSPKAFKHKKPKRNSDRTWYCTSNKNIVEFTMEASHEKMRKCFYIEDFFVNDKFPDPYLA